MKGITQCLRELAVGEVVDIVKTSRSDIHRIATRLDIKVKVQKTVWGFQVTRIPTEKAVIVIPRTEDLKQAKLAAIRAAMSGGGDIAIPITEQEPADHWIYLDNTFENGDILFWRQKPKGKPECYKRESNCESA